MKIIMLELLNRYRQLIVYCAIGCTGATLDFLLYSLLVGECCVYYQIANFASVSIGILNNFFWNFFFNFKVRDRIWARLCSFYLVGLFGWTLSAACLWLSVEKLRVNPIVAKLGTIVLVTVVQFGLNKVVTFRKRGVR